MSINLPFSKVTSDSELFALARALLLEQLPSNTAEIKQSFQTRNEGANKLATIYMFKITEANSGWPNRKDDWNETNDEFDHREEEFVESTLQFTIMVPPPAQSDTYAKTASDISRLAAKMLQTDFTISTLYSFGVGIFQIKAMPNPFFSNEQNRFEASASFDVVFRRLDTYVSTVPKISAYEAAIKPV
jgi:hypothetical protein